MSSPFQHNATAEASIAVNVCQQSDAAGAKKSADWQYIAPLGQSLLWVALIAGTIIWLRKPLQQVALALAKRIESGDSIEFPGVKLTGFQSAPAEGQAAKADDEATDSIRAEKLAAGGAEVDDSEIRDANPATTPTPTPTPTNTTAATVVAPIRTPDVTPAEKRRFQTRYLVAEDLALRAIQDEFKQPIQRQIAGMGGYPFDGFFLLGKTPYVIEVKYSSGLHAWQQAKVAVTKVKAALLDNGWNGVRIIVALVVPDPATAVALHDQLASRRPTEDEAVLFRVYILSSLEKRFGMT